MYENLKILLICPAFNEKGKIGSVIRKCKKLGFIDTILVVDDGSTDNTAEEAKIEGAEVISHKEREGVGAAIRTGIDYGLKNNFDVIVVISGDDQDRPEEIKYLLKKILENYDFVQGSRYLKGERTEKMPLFRKITTKLYTFIFRIFTGFPSTDATNGFRAFKISIFQNKDINIWQNWLNHYELEPYLFYKVIKNKFKVAEVPVTKIYHRDKGYSKMKPVKDWWKILRPLFFLKFGIKK